MKAVWPMAHGISANCLSLTGDQNRAVPLNFLTVVGHPISLMKDRGDVCVLLLLELEKVAGLSFLYSEASYWVGSFYNLF